VQGESRFSSATLLADDCNGSHGGPQLTCRHVNMLTR
jgi:hypothetical protein